MPPMTNGQGAESFLRLADQITVFPNLLPLDVIFFQQIEISTNQSLIRWRLNFLGNLSAHDWHHEFTNSRHCFSPPRSPSSSAVVHFALIAALSPIAVTHSGMKMCETR